MVEVNSQISITQWLDYKNFPQNEEDLDLGGKQEASGGCLGRRSLQASRKCLGRGQIVWRALWRTDAIVDLRQSFCWSGSRLGCDFKMKNRVDKMIPSQVETHNYLLFTRQKQVDCYQGHVRNDSYYYQHSSLTTNQ